MQVYMNLISLNYVLDCVITEKKYWLALSTISWLHRAASTKFEAPKLYLMDWTLHKYVVLQFYAVNAIYHFKNTIGLITFNLIFS